jgi:hypothetical protein
MKRECEGGVRPLRRTRADRRWRQGPPDGVAVVYVPKPSAASRSADISSRGRGGQSRRDPLRGQSRHEVPRPSTAEMVDIDVVTRSVDHSELRLFFRGVGRHVDRLRPDRPMDRRAWLTGGECRCLQMSSGHRRDREPQQRSDYRDDRGRDRVATDPGAGFLRPQLKPPQVPSPFP